MRVFITEFLHDGLLYEGPNIVAESFEAAEKTAELYSVIITDNNEDDYKRVLH